MYVALAVGVMALTWNNWWLDAKLAGVAHVVDIAVFTLLVFATDGYTSPFFVFFVFLVLSAAIRWGWRETAVTAAAVILLYFTAGLFAGDRPGGDFDLQRFIIRSGNLVILSAILIWFGINHGFSSPGSPKDEKIGDPSPQDSPLEQALERAARLTGATTCVLLWRAALSHHTTAIVLDGGAISTTNIATKVDVAPASFLFDFPRDRAFSRGLNRRMQFGHATMLVRRALGEQFGIASGLAVPVRTDAGEALLLLGGVKGLCTDHVEFGDWLGSALAADIQRHALLTAVEESAGARARLALARDLHDSIVQFLAGATFRIEAVKRSLRVGERPERELEDLKQLMLQEQQELRSAIGALRKNSVSLPALAADLKTLCDHLARQWDIRCTFAAEVADVAAPIRLHLDTHQLVREAVANAVRHGGAKLVDVQLTAENAQLRLDISNDGSGSDRLKKGQPWSLRERVEDANGTLMLASRESGTNVSITLPLKPEVRP